MEETDTSMALVGLTALPVARHPVHLRPGGYNIMIVGGML